MVRYRRQLGLEATERPRRRAENALADLAVGDRIVRKADGGRRPKSIWEIPVGRPATARERRRKERQTSGKGYMTWQRPKDSADG
jgi:hypothetical protein